VANANLQDLIRAELKASGWQVSEDAFTATTPVGKTPMRNIIGKLAGTSGRIVVFSGHYDTKAIPGIRFVGANDGGSSTGWLLEMARVLPKLPRKDDVCLVFFDGEEAFGDWSDANGIYGSRNLAQTWNRDSTLGRIRALINVDMIGDRDLKILDEVNSSPALRRLLLSAARDLGYSNYFPGNAAAIEDDHMPFVRLGVNAIDLIDYDYGPGNSYWHTAQDTMDKLSARSFQIVGEVLIEVFRRLQQQ
jgi:Zn-dependent M28 family amino/carboxypeptidase